MDWFLNADIIKLAIRLTEQYPAIAIMLMGGCIAVAVLWKDNMTLREMLFRELRDEKEKSKGLHYKINEVKNGNSETV